MDIHSTVPFVPAVPFTVEESGIETVAESTEGDQGTSTAGDSLSATLGEDSSELCEDLSHCELLY